MRLKSPLAENKISGNELQKGFATKRDSDHYSRVSILMVTTRKLIFERICSEHHKFVMLTFN